MEPLTVLAFVPAALALNLTPGADMMFCLGQGMHRGWRSAVAASAGISAGAMVHVTVAGLGLGAVLAAAPWVFEAIRWVGVGYLLWLAYATVRQPHQADVPPISAARAFRDGMLVNLTNPKVILFILAFVPQFVNPQAPVLAQFLVFGGILALGGFLINGAVGLCAGRMAAHLAGRGRRILAWLSAGIFCALALRLAFFERA